jgi:hypothetical protein
MVTQRVVDRCWKRDGQPGPVPDVHAMGPAIRAEMGKFQRQMRIEENRRAMLAPDETPAPARVVAPPAPAKTKEGDEARVAMMKGAEALALVAKHKLAWPGPHPTNPGITAMRAKNALYVFVRRGGSL